MLMLKPSQIKQLRLSLGMTRLEFALSLGLKSEQAVYQWESGRRHPRYEHLEKLNELLTQAQKEHGLVLAQ
jgi:transcriptional regulator with XRE-family HTH domain